MLVSQQAKLRVDDCPLAWWAKYKNLFPELAEVARCFLGVQATSCASERLFSKAGFIVSKHRTSLSKNHVGMLTFMATNADAEI